MKQKNTQKVKKGIKPVPKEKASPVVNKNNKKTWKIITVILIIITIILGLFFYLRYTFFAKYAFAELEIERKFVVDLSQAPYNFDAVQSDFVHLDQSYIMFEPEIRLRKINHAWKNKITYQMTIKSDLGKTLLTRGEIDFPISETLYNLLFPLHRGIVIEKTRYDMSVDGFVYEIDKFHGDLDGLEYLEVEFDSEQEAMAFKPPSWVIEDVTEDKKYKNGSLAKYGLPESFYQYNIAKDDQ